MLPLFWFTVRQILLQRKLWIVSLLLVAPAVLVLLIRTFAPVHGVEDLAMRFHVPLMAAMFMLTMPLACLLYGTSLVGAEVDAGTFVYLTTRKLRRATTLLVRYLAGAIVLSVLADVAILLVFCVAAVGVDVAGANAASGGLDWHPWQDLGHYLLVAPLGVATFLAVFTAISLVTAKPLSLAVAYFILVEIVLSNVPLDTCVVSVSHYLRKTLFNGMPWAMRMYDHPPAFMEHHFPPGSTGTAVLLVVMVAMLGLASLAVSLRELVPARVARE